MKILSPPLHKRRMMLPKRLNRFLITHFLIIPRLRLLAVPSRLRRHISRHCGSWCLSPASLSPINVIRWDFLPLGLMDCSLWMFSSLAHLSIIFSKCRRFSRFPVLPLMKICPFSPHSAAASRWYCRSASRSWACGAWSRGCTRLCPGEGDGPAI